MSLLGMLTPPPASFDLPPDISTHAAEIDATYDFIWWFSVVFAIIMYALTIYWCWKYRRRPGHKPEKTDHYPRLEIAWTVLPVFFIIYLFHIGFASYIKTAIAADDAIEIRAKGQQWLWTFTYPNGRSEPDELYVPINKPIKFLISSYFSHVTTWSTAIMPECPPAGKNPPRGSARGAGSPAGAPQYSAQ